MSLRKRVKQGRTTEATDRDITGREREGGRISISINGAMIRLRMDGNHSLGHTEALAEALEAFMHSNGTREDGTTTSQYHSSKRQEQMVHSRPLRKE